MAVEGEGKFFTLVRTPDGDRDAWLAQRRKGVGGSDVAAIMGLSPWRSVYQTWAEKSGLIEAEDISEKPAIVWGNILEPIVGEHYAQAHPDRIVRRLNAVCQSIERPWAQASLDYEVKDPELGWGILEIKTAGLRSAAEWDDGVPLFYQTQVAHYMSVTGRPFADVAVLIGGQDYREYRIMRDEDDIRAVEKAVDDFWGMVRTGLEPPVGSCDGAALFSRHREPDGDIAELDETPYEVSRYIAAKKSYEAAKELLDTARNQLCSLIGDRKGFTCPDGKVTWLRTKSARLDTKALKQDHPDLYEAYQIETDRNMGIRLTKAKEK